MSDRFVVISGCSGGGKSTLLIELQLRGYAVVDEPGRRIVKQELASGGGALPWSDPAAFARGAVHMALADLEAARPDAGRTFFDRGLVDAAAALETATGDAVLERLGRTHRYCATVFFTPPWPELFVQDQERRHGFEAAVAEYERLLQVYPALGYRVVAVPKVSVEARADFVLGELGDTL